MNVLSNLFNILKRFPIKTIMIAGIVVLILAIGVSNMYMATGNDTLVKTDTDVYEDNQKLEEEFGGESIVVLYEADVLLTPSHLEHMKGIESELQTNDSIYSVISPVTLVEEIAKKQSDEFQDGITDIIEGLDDMGNRLIETSEKFGKNAKSEEDMKLPEMDKPELPELSGVELPNIGSPQLVEPTLPKPGDKQVPDISGDMSDLNGSFLNRIKAQENLGEATENLVGGYDRFSEKLSEVGGSLLLLSGNMGDSPGKKQLEKTSQKLKDLLRQMSQVSEDAGQLPTIPDETIKDLNNITLGGGLYEIGEKLQSISENMETIEEYSDIMSPGLPKKQATLDNMIYDADEKLRTMFEEVVLDDNHMIMMIKFKGHTSDTEKSNVVKTINTYLDTKSIDSVDTIVSGKPVLDNSIRSSMQESIQQMMGLALLIMIVVLFFVFKVRWRLLPLLTVLIAVIGTIGLMGWLQIPITMVSMAVFPILIGLGIDYAIQFQTRYTEEMAKEDSNE